MAEPARVPRPVLVLLPGMDGTGLLFAPLQQWLQPRCDVHVVSYPQDVLMDYDALTKHVRPQLPVDRPWLLLGESFGGPLALMLADQGLPNLRGLILCCTFARHPWAVLARWTGWLPAVLPPLRVVTWLLLGRRASTDARAMLAQTLARVRADVMRARLWQALAVDTRAQLVRLRLPLLYLQARRDRLVGASAGAEVQRLCRQAKRVVLDTTHGLLQSQPEAAARLIGDFVARHAVEVSRP